MTTIHEDSATYTVSTSSFTRGDRQATHAIIFADSMTLLQKVKSGMGSPDWNVSMVDIHLRQLLWVYCPRHARVKGDDRADRLAGKATLTSGLIASLKIRSVEELETLPAGTKPRTSHHRSPGGDRRGKRKR